MAPGLAFDVMSSGVTAPAGLVEQPDEHPGSKKGGRHPVAPQTALRSRRPPPFALQDTAEPFVPAKGRASLSYLVPFGGLSQQGPSPRPPEPGGGSVAGIVAGKQQDVSVSLYPTPMKGTCMEVFTTLTLVPHPTNTWGRAAGGGGDPLPKVMPLKETMPGNELGESNETPICGI